MAAVLVNPSVDGGPAARPGSIPAVRIGYPSAPPPRRGAGGPPVCICL